MRARGFLWGLALTLAAASTPGAASGDLEFPRDHGAHPGAAVEWWYYTGHLGAPGGREYGFQLTFFRVRDLHLAHFAWSDVAAKRFVYDEKMHLGMPGIAAAAQGRLEISNEDWTAVERAGEHRLAATGRAGRLELRLRPVKAPVVHGPGGVSRKGSGAEEYSRYVSVTRLAAQGTLHDGKASRPLTGTAWFDHEWGPGVLPAEAAGWDWFALQLDDGSELMLYRIRRAGGDATPFSSGTFVPGKGAPVPIGWRDVRIDAAGFWVSPRSRARYPSGWRITVARLGLAVSVEPVLPDQELLTPDSTGVTYWEGACRVKGSRGGRPVSGRAYAELTGYAGRDVPGLAQRGGYSIFSDSTFAVSTGRLSLSERLAVLLRVRVLPTAFVSSVTRNVAASRRLR